MRYYFYALLRKYLSLFILPHNSVVEIDPASSLLVGAMPQGKVAFRNTQKVIPLTITDFQEASVLPVESVYAAGPDYLVVSGLIHYERDIQGLLGSLRKMCRKETRLVLTYYSSLWRPLASLASRIGMRRKLPESNWLAHEDVKNLLELENFELVRLDHKVLIPFYIPLISNLFNRYIAPLPLFKNFCLLNIAIARPLIGGLHDEGRPPSVSIVVPARNEAGHIDDIVQRIPAMGPNDEIIFIEGNSTDDTWSAIQAAQARYGEERRIIVAQQDGKGKGDAVRKGFALATNEILMILDADMTVPPEDLPKFYHAIKDGKGEFINGTRLVYPMEKEAMRFCNLLGNKFFAMAFSFVLGQRFKDTLCGTKVISRANYLQLANNRSYFGDFDPFGDFDLIFGAARMGLKIVEVPICYRERVYGETNISRWRHGAILLAMLIFSARRIKFL
ncbi:glycosyltransferase family 2 protein [Nitratidesulfovibrio liaohensis]|uniref:Glycosyltransferase family 2 protein n=1 Tax=Nitratidesulfovibrio liaohensis TaxID=2604158 RepID=A0ABY9R3C2_9BACT|nr:glycosyltransferase family 2 protein [Nitratidesulfovibrio liaohensis]WMW66266.1 glycosyltransferase family 2 protein [Nitratidesulfovibrio liaohensis]